MADYDDGCSADARRYRDLVEAFSAEYGLGSRVRTQARAPMRGHRLLREATSGGSLPCCISIFREGKLGLMVDRGFAGGNKTAVERSTFSPSSRGGGGPWQAPAPQIFCIWPSGIFENHSDAEPIIIVEIFIGDMLERTE
jgi:hypothetical protein